MANGKSLPFCLSHHRCARRPARAEVRTCGVRFSVLWRHSCRHLPDVEMNLAVARQSVSHKPRAHASATSFDNQLELPNPENLGDPSLDFVNMRDHARCEKSLRHFAFTGQSEFRKPLVPLSGRYVRIGIQPIL